MKRYQVLEKAVKLIDEPSAWCRHTGARDKDGNSVDPLDENAVSFCVIGAVQRVLGEKGKDQSLSGDLNAVLGLLPGGIVSFNDSIDTMHEDVVDMFEEAIQKEKFWQFMTFGLRR